VYKRQLIGRLKTFVSINLLFRVLDVSIPHR